MKTGITALMAASAAASQALVIAGWGPVRGGGAAMPTDPGYAYQRGQIQSYFPGTTFYGVETLTTESLALADVVWLYVAYTGHDGVSPLTQSEQTVLRDFVLAGHTAIICSDNDSFSFDAAQVNAGVLSPFGVHSFNTFNGVVVHTPIHPNSYPNAGPRGTAGTLMSGWAGCYDGWPTGTQQIAYLGSEQYPSVLGIPAGLLAPGSGKVWLCSDTCVDDGSGNWSLVFANMLDQNLLIGGVDLEDLAVSPAGQLISIEFWQGGSMKYRTMTRLETSGGFHTNASLPPGHYSVYVKGTHWLQNAHPDFAWTGSGVMNIAGFTCKNGDVDGDNEVGLGDFGVLSSAFGTFDGDPGFVSGADLDGDGEIGLSDFGILSQNFGEIGD